MADTLAELEREYTRKLNKAEEEDKPAIRLEYAEAKANFYEQRAQQAERSAALNDVFSEFPYAKEFQDLITGATPDEIRESAKKIHERIDAQRTAALESVKPELESARARSAYGAPATGGTGTPPTARQDPNEQFLQSFVQRFNNREQVTPAEVARYEALRGGRRFAEAVGEGGKRWSLDDLSKDRGGWLDAAQTRR